MSTNVPTKVAGENINQDQKTWLEGFFTGYKEKGFTFSDASENSKQTPKQKKFAALAEPRDKITYADKIAGATGKSKKMKQGGMVRGGGAAIRGNNFKGVY